jgi:type II secretion system protein H
MRDTKHKPAYLRAYRSNNGRNTALAFTLIEILIVIVIIGIGISIAVANLFVSEEERVRQESERLIAIIEKTRDEAVFSGYPVLMRFTDKGIEFSVRDTSSITPIWQDASSQSLAPRAWRDGVTASLVVSNAGNNITNNDTGKKSAQTVTFLPAGVSAPYNLRVYSEKFERIIAGDALGNVSFVDQPP